jgi:hypothetical protein
LTQDPARRHTFLYFKVFTIDVRQLSSKICVTMFWFCLDLDLDLDKQVHTTQVFILMLHSSLSFNILFGCLFIVLKLSYCGSLFIHPIRLKKHTSKNSSVHFLMFLSFHTATDSKHNSLFLASVEWLILRCYLMLYVRFYYGLVGVQERLSGFPARRRKKLSF